MKAILALMILSISFQSLEAREWVSKVRKYIHKDSNQIIEDSVLFHVG